MGVSCPLGVPVPPAGVDQRHTPARRTGELRSGKGARRRRARRAGRWSGVWWATPWSVACFRSGSPAQGQTSLSCGQHGHESDDASRRSSPVALRAIAPAAEHLVAVGRLASGLFRQRIDVVQLQRAALCAPGMGMDGFPANALMYPAVASGRSLAVLRATAPFTHPAAFDAWE
jgi:hypothetical protein